nr:MAG TPA: hypothetical protein [Caudoviricetes sp.]
MSQIAFFEIFKKFLFFGRYYFHNINQMDGLWLGIEPNHNLTTKIWYCF